MNFSELKDFEKWDSIKQIDYGWSEDGKYIITMKDKKYVLRVSDIKYYEKKKYEYELMKRLYDGFKHMSVPLAFGTFDNNQYVYILVGYIEGDQAEKIVPQLTEKEQYEYGVLAGQYLKKIHEVLGPVPTVDFRKEYVRKIEQRIEEYRSLEIPNELIEKMILYVKEHLYLIDDVPAYYNHGDYHVGNLIVGEDKELYVIDFNRVKIADPLYEFNRLLISSQFCPLLAKGQIDGYFDGEVSIEVFRRIKFYIASVQIGTLAWAMKYSDDDVEFAYQSMKHFYETFDEFKSDIPNWYERKGD
jgi:serine/threonine-protein kinase